MHVFAEPLGEPALADACFSVQEDELLAAAFGVNRVFDDRAQLGALLVARDQRARPQPQKSERGRRGGGDLDRARVRCDRASSTEVISCRCRRSG